MAVVWDAHLGGWPVSLIGIESRPLPRHGVDPRRRAGAVDVRHPVPARFEEDRPRDQRRQRPAPGRRAGQPRRFDGSPESMRKLAARVRRRDRPRRRQLRRARSCSASCRATTAARSWSSPRSSTPTSRPSRFEGAHASVIGGAPAAAVVFARDVEQAARSDERIARSTSASPPPRGPSASACARARGAVERRAAPRSAASSRPSSTPPTASSARSAWGR